MVLSSPVPDVIFQTLSLPSLLRCITADCSSPPTSFHILLPGLDACWSSPHGSSLPLLLSIYIAPHSLWLPSSTSPVVYASPFQQHNMHLQSYFFSSTSKVIYLSFVVLGHILTVGDRVLLIGESIPIRPILHQMFRISYTMERSNNSGLLGQIQWLPNAASF